MQTFKVDVVVYAVVRNKATVLTRDGTLFGPTRLGSLHVVYGLEQIERVWWQRVLDDYRQVHDPNDVVADVAQDDIAEPNDDGLVANANDVVADDAQDDIAEANDDGVVDPHIAADEAAPPPVLVAVPVYADAFACDICGDDAKFACSGACHYCAECLVRYSETLFEGKAPSQVPPCAQGCGSVMDWKTMACAIDSDAKFARLVTHFAASETSTVHDTLKEEDTVDSLLDKVRAKALADLAETQTLMKPCCKTAFFDFQDCFAVKCNNCPSAFFCAWCMEHVSDNSADAHAHVRVCAQNAQPGAAYGDYDQWDAHCRAKKRQRLDSMKHMLADKLDECSTALNESQE
jgi:hypothetical protein